GRGESVTPRRGRWSSIVVAVQMALVFVLTVAGSLVIGSLWWAFRQDPGFSPGQTAVVDLSAGAGTLAERNDRFRIAVARLRELPGVTHVGVVAGPFLRRGWRVPPLNDPALRREQLVTVGGDFFEMLGLGAIEGRLPTPQELSSSAPVAVVSDRIARRMWPGETAVGRVLAGSSFQYQVIGVVPDARFSGLDDSSRGQIYWPIGSGLGSTILVAGATPGDETLRRVLEAIRAAGPASGVTRATTVDRTFTELLRRRLFVAWFYGLFAASALVIVGVGILGLVAMSTAARTREIGIRSSLGATGDRLVRGLVAEQLAPVAAGLAMGGVIAAWAVTYLRSTLYEFSIYDTRLWSIAAAALLLTATVGALIPAVRAARIDPVRALRTD
ncbi:MAG TPA: ABC transporter permease, partial [Vicinamibacterales bacterium]|nr:ABC transporter permease [Vicinamibacterales bacterium]